MLTNINSVQGFHSVFIYYNKHQKKRSNWNSNQNCWGAEKPCSKIFALDTSQSFLTCRGMRGLFCSRHVKDSDHVNTTVRVSGEVWSALLRAEGLWGSRISCKVGLTVVKMCVVWFPQQGKENTQAHHPPQYFCKHTTLISLSGSQNTFRMQNKGASRFLFS